MSLDKTTSKVFCGMHTMSNDLIDDIRMLQEIDEVIQEKRKLFEAGTITEFEKSIDGIWRCNGKFVCPTILA